ncbi:MAG: hypothetical protein HW405_610 [Candidatus Berkelbacteria bacterium]|nr:hypothetical protein [Candidatus Berkelbacteria bacterium]
MKKIIVLVILFFIFLILPQKASATNIIEEQILKFHSDITINTDSSVDVREEINYFFSSPRHGFYRKIPYHYKDASQDRYFKTPITILSVKDTQEYNWPYEESRDGTDVILKIGDPNKTVEGEQTYIISYNVSGVINYFADHDELYWNVTGARYESQDGVAVPINNASARAMLPEKVNYETLQYKCFTGPLGSSQQDCQKSFEAGKVDFSSNMGPLTIVVGINKGIIQVIQRNYDLKLRHESYWYWLILPIVFILLLIRYFLSGRDAPGRETIAPEFEPPDNLKPAEMGTLVDEKADRKDISATLIDLAVRGYLKIKEGKDKKYTLYRIKDDESGLDEIEKQIFMAIFSGKKEIKLSEISHSLGKEINDIQDSLYNRMVEKKYFIKNPERARSNNCAVAVLFILLPWGLFWFSWNLVTVLFLSGILIAIYTRSMPKKTREGAITKEKSLGFKEFLFRAERYKLKWQEKENIFEKYLPYAMVFGIADKWAQNFKDLYKNPPDWYKGGNWTTFNAVVFASSLNSFNSSAVSSFSPPVSTSASSGGSGFSGGGGSSGGGFGGGGGGSW